MSRDEKRVLGIAILTSALTTLATKLAEWAVEEVRTAIRKKRGETS